MENINTMYFKEMMHYVLFSIIGFLGNSCYILVDTYFIAKGIGANGLAALNIALPIYNLIYAISQMMAMGAATKFALKKHSSSQYEKDKLYSNTLVVTIFISLFLLALGIFKSDSVASLLGADSEILANTSTYMKWLLIFAPAYMLNQILMFFIRNDGKPKLVTWAMLLASLSNIVLDYIFIFIFDMGIFGAIIATCIGQIVSLFVMSWHFILKNNHFNFIFTKIDKEIIKEDINLGFPSFVTQISAGFVVIVFNYLILKLEGNIGVAAYGVVANIAIVTVGIMNGIASGIQPLVSSAYGQGLKNKFEYLHNQSILLMAIISSAIYAITYIFAEPIAALFNESGDIALQAIAVEGLKLYFLALIFVGYNVIIAVFYTSSHNTKPIHILSLFRGLFLIVPVAFLMAHLFGMKGIWLSLMVTELIIAVVSAIIYKRLPLFK